MSEFYNYLIFNIKVLLGFTTFFGLWLLYNVFNNTLFKKKYLSILLITINWAFPIVILSKAGKKVLDQQPTNDSLFIFIFLMIMYMVMLSLVPLLISIPLRKKYSIEKTFCLLVSIWYFIYVIPQLYLLFGWFASLKGLFSWWL